MFQNSIKAFEYALEYSDGIETDACLSKDGKIFLIHETTKNNKYTIDSYISKESQEILGDKRLDMLTSAEISTLHLKNGDKILQLTDILPLFTNKPNKILNIELKSHNIEKPLISLLKNTCKNGIIRPRQVIISSFNHLQLANMKDILPDVKLGALFDYFSSTHNTIYPWLEKSPIYIKPSLENIKKIASYVDYLIVPYMDISTDLLQNIKNIQPNKKIILWQKSKEEEINLTEIKNTISGYNDIIEAIIVNNPKVKK